MLVYKIVRRFFHTDDVGTTHSFFFLLDNGRCKYHFTQLLKSPWWLSFKKTFFIFGIWISSRSVDTPLGWFSWLQQPSRTWLARPTALTTVWHGTPNFRPRKQQVLRARDRKWNGITDFQIHICRRMCVCILWTVCLSCYILLTSTEDLYF